MCEPTTIAAVASVVISAYSAYSQNETSNKIAEHNARTAETNAQDRLKTGEQEAQAAQRQARELMGAQRAAFSARGLDIGEGTPSDLIAQTDFFGQADAATARTNARKDAWNLRAQKVGYQLEASGYNPRLAAAGSLLGSAGSVSDRWQKYRSSGLTYGG